MSRGLCNTFFLKAPEKGGLHLSVLLVQCVCKEKDPGSGVCF